MTNVQKRMNSSHYIQVDEEHSNLLNTIRIPKNLNFLHECLPKANYSPIKFQYLDRQ